jgi:hypothetical protein
LVLTASIYNADHVNHITNGVPAQLDDYSVNAAQMQLTADPGESGTESLATNLAGELERSRFMLKEIGSLIQGATLTQWYSSVSGNRRMLIQVDAYTAPGANTWTKPTGCNAALVFVFAGGGGGGSANAAAGVYAAGGGGGGGGLTIDFITSGLGATETVTVGDGGLAEAAGGDTTFGAHVTAVGGSGGGGTTSGFAAGGAGGTASGTGIIGFAGNSGRDGLVAGTTMQGGEGGAGPWGGGARGSTATGTATFNGDDASSHGAGGGGGLSGDAGGFGTGGAGTVGAAIVLSFT